MKWFEMKNWKAYLGVLSIVVVFFLSSILVGLLLPRVVDARMVGEDLMMLINYCTVFGLTILWAAVSGATIFGFEVPNLRPEIRRLNPTLIVGGVILILAMNIVLQPVLPLLPEVGQDILDDYMKSGLWAMISAVVVAPVLEEYLFRGVVQRNLELRVGAVWSIVITSLLFGAIHVIPQQVVAATAAGLVLGMVYYITRSLNSVIAIHVVNNGLSYLFFWIYGADDSLEANILGSGVLYYAVYGVSLLLIVGAWFVLRRVVRRRLAFAQSMAEMREGEATDF